MKEINIYKIATESFLKVFIKLIESIIAQNKKIYLLCNNNEELEKLDYLLWSFSQLSFIPHGTIFDLYPQEQTVLLGIDPYYPTTADVIIITHYQPQTIDIIQSLIDKYDKCLIFKSDETTDITPITKLNILTHLITQLDHKWIKSKL